MKGFTLIEILIAISIFVIIAMIIISTIAFGSAIYEKSENIMELTQNGRVVLDVISREVRQAERIVNSLPERKEDAVNEIIFKDGHLDEIRETGIIQAGQDSELIFPDEASDKDDFYKGSYIKITSGSADLIGEIRKIVDYDGSEKRAQIEFPFKEEGDYFGLEYMIDTSYYYIHYYLEDGFFKRAVSAYYFSDSPEIYVPINSIPPDGETLEKDLIEARIIGEHFSNLEFWEDEGINIFIDLNLDGKEMELLKKISGRNL